jgi:hypothetical protein
MLPPERWALTPPFHPYRAASPSAIRLRGLLSGRLKVFLQMATEARCTGGLFSVALSVAENLASLARSAPGAGCTCSPPRQSSDPLALPGALPLWSLPRRATNFHSQQQARRPRCPDFPPGRLPCESRPSDHPAHPPGASISSAPKRRVARFPERQRPKLPREISMRDDGRSIPQAPATAPRARRTA